MSGSVISIENVSKSYHLGQIGSGTLRDDLQSWWHRVRGRPDPNLRVDLEHRAVEGRILWALQDVSLSVGRGEVLGIIGRNGAGKSTLLKILSRVTAPTSGRIRVKGRVASLLEVGTGFHPELTGRENVFLNGAILGMTKAEVARKFDEIVAFSEIEPFIDTPVKRYSSGMYVRLAFAVAAHLEPEILVVDEVLAVGDAAFQKKCIGKIGAVANAGRTVLFVSHNMASIQSLCTHAVVLQHGRVVFQGTGSGGVDYYLGTMGEGSEARVLTKTHSNRLPNMAPVIETVSIANSKGKETTDFSIGELPVLTVKYDAQTCPQPVAGCGFILESSRGVRVGSFNTYMSTPPPHSLPKAGRVSFRLRSPRLTPGQYHFTVSLGSHQNHLIDKIERVVAFTVHPEDIYQTGYILTPEDGVAVLDVSCEATAT